MDHLLFDQRNLLPKYKREYSEKFQVTCKENPDDLKNSIFNTEIATTDSYTESWRQIQIGCMSLQRHTNINLFFDSESAKNQK